MNLDLTGKQKRSLLGFFTFLFVFVVFIPLLWGGLSIVDDSDLVERIQRFESWDFKSIFFYGQAKGLYYRPFVRLSGLIDYHFFSFHPVIMHLETILFHLLNVYLMVLVTKRVLRELDVKSEGFFHLLPALVFGVHPVVTESVAWMSGRTDIFALTFLLASTLQLLAFRSSRRPLNLATSALFFLGALLSKEASITFLAGWILLLTAKSKDQPSTTNRLYSWLIPVGTGLVAVVGFITLRAVSIAGNAGGVGRTIQFILVDPWFAFTRFAGATGFYTKKMFFPWPLNFGITQIDPLYELFAIPVLLFCLYLLCRRGLKGAIFLTGMFLMVPSFVVTFNQIAWTPYAERYIYMSTAFVTLAVCLYFRQNLTFSHQWSRIVFVLSVVLVLSSATSYRAWIWASNERLMADTVEKSPRFKAARITYGEILERQNKPSRALEQYEVAASLQPIGYDPIPHIKMAELSIRQGQMRRAAGYLLQAMEKSKLSNAKGNRRGLALVKKLKNERVDHRLKKSFRENKTQHLKSGNAQLLLSQAKMLLYLGEKKVAKQYLKLATEAPLDRYKNRRYVPRAETYSQSLERQ